MIKQKKILITGASGFTGSHACEYFSDNGYDVFGVVRKKRKGFLWGKQIVCDLSNAEKAMKAVSSIKPEFVLHLAGQNSVADSWNNPRESIQANVLGTVNLLEAIREHQPDAKIIVVGSMLQESPSDPASHPYSLSKTMQMLVAKAWEQLFSMDILLVKPSNLIGPGPSNGVCSIFAKKIAEMERGDAKRILEVKSLQDKRDFLDVRDAVRAYGVLFQKGQKGQIYELGTGMERKLLEIVEGFRQCSHIEFEVVELAQGEKKLPTPFREYSHLCKLTELGWSPSTNLLHSLNDSLEYHRLKQGKKRNE